MVFSILPWQSAGTATTVSVHTQTTQIVLQEGATSANVLMGYVSVTVQRPTTVTSLDVEFSGRQRLDWRQGEGPSAAMHTLKHNCADISYCLLDGSDDGAAATAAAAKLLGSSTRTSSRCSLSDSVHTSFDSHQLSTYSPVNISRQSTSCDTVGSAGTPNASTIVLGPGEYRFAFEFVVPDTLPASVISPLGGVSFSVSATMKRSWYQTAIVSPAVNIDIVRAPPMQPPMSSPTLTNNSERLLLGFSSLPALASAPLLFKAAVGSHWDISVYAPSHALFLGSDTQIHVFATSKEATDDMVELVELSATMSERILHSVPHGKAQRTTQQVVAICSLDDSTLDESKTECMRVLRHQQFDPQTIHALGDSFAELLPPAGALHFTLPRAVAGSKSGRGAQPSSASPVFSVAHELRISVAVRIPDEGGKEYRLSFTAPVLVLPEALANSHGAPSSLPCYASISNDIVLAATVVASSLAPTCTCALNNIPCTHYHLFPPEYNTLYI
ncbi:hypothetical protein GGI13_000947 [Coemansia sp. RSA 455]|nr:hypothetical protein GGI14_003712 [Coemansia sp. S680]KAJ2054861.1 hypothetical protein GGI08_004379 [Coemansia sp. S2]KAJ2094588.1 hypothetical protein GGI09_005321 [Coemansia sp. S100]KAJ2113214.1 hypothetical protein IW146_004039 [Coemansia sp. RSA 922]KAJ2257271.1 hypothetical protein GGI13_000947 [Coemansia sp. RSA 455]KAJ2464219.1 hypothetical protein GGI03_003363 [Coemansia sp. RSA 2337]